MIDLSKKILTDGVFVCGEYYPVRTDFRVWVDFPRKVREMKDLRETDWYYRLNDDFSVPRAPQDKEASLAALIDFYAQKSALPRSVGGGKAALFDFSQDADLLYAAFYEQYGIDLLKTDLHWVQFLALFYGLHGTKLNDVMGYRSYEGFKNRDLARLRDAWALEVQDSAEECAELAAFDALLK